MSGLTSYAAEIQMRNASLPSETCLPLKLREMALGCPVLPEL